MNRIVVMKPELLTTDYEYRRFEFGARPIVASDIITAFKLRGTPLVGVRTKRNAAQEYHKRPLVVAYFDVNYSHEFVADSERVRRIVAEVAQHYDSDSEVKIQFAVSSETEFADELKMLGLDDSGEDVNVGYWGPDGARYPMEPTDNLGVEELRAFVKDVQDGKVKPFIRSAHHPYTKMAGCSWAKWFMLILTSSRNSCFSFNIRLFPIFFLFSTPYTPILGQSPNLGLLHVSSESLRVQT
jgi:protein disulfide-isomerase A4